MYRERGEQWDSAQSVLEQSDASVSREQSTHDVDVSELENLQGSVFDELIEFYDHFKKEMLNSVVRYVVTDVKARCRSYCHDKLVARFLFFASASSLTSWGVT